MVGFPNKPMGFPTKNDQHLGCLGCYHHLRKHPKMDADSTGFFCHMPGLDETSTGRGSTTRDSTSPGKVMRLMRVFRFIMAFRTLIASISDTCLGCPWGKGMRSMHLANVQKYRE